MMHEHRDSALQSARATVGAFFCTALAMLAIASNNPLLLAAVAIAAIIVGWQAHVLGRLTLLLKYGLPFALLLGLLNAFFSRQGFTVFARLGRIPPLGEVDLTVEALVYGLVLAARMVIATLCFGLLATAVDPDELLRGLRRRSPRLGLTAAMAIRMLPLLTSDGKRLADARRLRPPGSPGAGRGRRRDVLVLQAVMGSAFERSIQLATTLELRGYGNGMMPPRQDQPRSLHDIRLVAASAVFVLVMVFALATGASSMQFYDTIKIPNGTDVWLLAAIIIVTAAAPFASRRGVQ